MSARRWLFERLRRATAWVAPATPDLVGLDDYEHGCERHAYCAAMAAALAGDHVTVIPGTGPEDGEPVTVTFHRPLTKQQAKLAAHKHPRFRAGFAVIAAREVHRDLRQRGQIK